MKRFIYILLFAVAFSALFSIRALAVGSDSPPMPNDYMSGSDSDKEQGFFEWLGDYSTYLYTHSQSEIQEDYKVLSDFNRFVVDVANNFGVDVSNATSDVTSVTQETIDNIYESHASVGRALKDVHETLQDAILQSILGPDYKKKNTGSGSGSGFNPNQGAPSGGTSYPLSNGGQIVVNDFGTPQPPHSVDLYNDTMENNYCLLEVLSYDRHGNVIDSFYLCTAEIYASDAYITNPLSFDGGIYQGAWCLLY